MNTKKHKKFTNKDWGWMTKDVADSKSVRIPNALYFLWATIYQIKERYNIATLTGRVGLVAWWFINGVEEYPEFDIAFIEDDRLFEPPDIPEQINASYPVSRLALATAELNNVFISSLNLSKDTDNIKIINWYYRHAVKGKRDITSRELKYFYEEAPDIKQDTIMPITRAMVINWHDREDVQSIFDLSDRTGRLEFESWWLCYGYRDAPPYRLPEYQYSNMLEIATEIEQDTYLPIIRAMLVYWKARKDLQKQCDLSTKEGRLNLESWWLTDGYRGLAPYELTQDQYSGLLKEAPNIIQDSDVPFTQEMAIIWNSSKKLRKSYDLTTQKGRQAYIQWWNENAADYAYSIPAMKKTDGIPIASNNISSKDNDRYIAGSYLSGGINLIGLAKGELGIGEDVRMAARALGVAGINFSIFNFPKQSYSRQKDLSLASHIKDELVYSVNMVNLTGFEHASLFVNYGKKVFDKRYTIGAWPWELPLWPRLCDNVFHLVDEIWASSRYAVDAYSNSPVPVVHMPMAVDFDSVPEYTRSDFKLPPDTYLFLYVFDSLSYMARKNPIAHLEAFWKAFPRSRRDVGLVVKTMNADLDNETWKKFHEMVSSDDRIILIKETLSRNKILGLMNNCDAFLSLHRSEGFGRCIAEMMWLGKPIIATNYSGNIDFTTEDTAFLVDGPLVVVGKGDYPYGENQYWCNPDVDEAANHMRTCFEGGEDVKIIAVEGKKLIRQNYSFDAVATRYTERLKHLGIL